MNWISFGDRSAGLTIRKANLTVAITYSLFFTAFFAIGTGTQRLGLVVLSAPVVLNWMSYFKSLNLKDSVSV